MSLVGNDVVDLGDPAIESSHLRERFLARVLSVDERGRLSRAAEPKVLLWALFAAKEAAYKVISKLHPLLPFAHRRFEVAADLSTVSHGETTVELDVEVGDSFIHAVAWTGLALPVWGLGALEPGADPSLAARGGLLAEIGGSAGLVVEREPRPGSWDGFGPPRVLQDGASVGLDVSLSHDGRYVAWALVPQALGFSA